MPPLENGDRLSRAEFERRYAAMPEDVKAELIEGVVHMAAAARLTRHGQPWIHLSHLLANYYVATPGTVAAGGPTIRLDLDNMPQPDCVLLIDPAHGGQAHVDDDDYVSGAPELVAEVSGSTASYDLHAKKNVYRRNGVREYIVWRTHDKALDWFVLQDGEYVSIAPENDILKSRVFPGLWLDAAALMRRDMPRVMAVANEGLMSSEHAAFASQLQKTKA
jgi:Uma2 family endonuclease